MPGYRSCKKVMGNLKTRAGARKRTAWQLALSFSVQKAKNEKSHRVLNMSVVKDARPPARPPWGSFSDTDNKPEVQGKIRTGISH